MSSKAYTPHPIDTSRVRLSDEVQKLTERLSENAHENWAQQRIGEGWIYGSKRNDARKEHPCLIPYEDLPESEKEYDRIIAIETLKVILAFGYKIEKD